MNEQYSVAEIDRHFIISVPLFIQKSEWLTANFQGDPVKGCEREGGG